MLCYKFDRPYKDNGLFYLHKYYYIIKSHFVASSCLLFTRLHKRSIDWCIDVLHRMVEIVSNQRHRNTKHCFVPTAATRRRLDWNPRHFAIAISEGLKAYVRRSAPLGRRPRVEKPKNVKADVYSCAHGTLDITNGSLYRIIKEVYSCEIYFITSTRTTGKQAVPTRPLDGNAFPMFKVWLTHRCSG